ncbi:hypothetical protein DFH06DRAFT_1121749 [Mycena polygramma]|nr:hypothetical protein DFH06DRAFT_1121749 [Mycena polygramma]
MPPHDLTPSEIAKLMGPSNHPSPVSLTELDNLLGPLTNDQLEEVVNEMGLGDLARQLPPVLLKVFDIAKRKLAARPVEEDDAVDSLIRHLDAVQLFRPRTPPSPGERSTTTPPSVTPTTPSSTAAGPTPSTAPAPTPAAAPSTPQQSASRVGYIVDSPTKVGKTVCWLEAGSLTQGIRGASRGPPAAAYAVFYGAEVGTFTEWARVQRAITGGGVAIHCGFDSIESATAALDYARLQGWTADSNPPPGHSALPLSAQYEDNPLTSGRANDLWYAVCRGVRPGVYRSYLECALNTVGVKGNLCASFATRQEAETAFTNVTVAGYVRTIPRAAPIV